MSQNLSSMIDEINDASSKLASTTGRDANGAAASTSGPSPSSALGDPLAQIVRVLNGHLQQLQTIDSGAAALAQKVERAQKDVRTVGDAGRGVGGDRQWLDGFGRSYLGRS
jgi:nuclear pore complex protein Nup62